MGPDSSIPDADTVLNLLQNGQICVAFDSGELRLLSAKKAAEKAGFSVATLHRSVGAGVFPAPIKVGDTMVRWVSTEVEDWIRQSVNEHRREELKKAAAKGGFAKAANARAAAG